MEEYTANCRDGAVKEVETLALGSARSCCDGARSAGEQVVEVGAAQAARPPRRARTRTHPLRWGGAGQALARTPACSLASHTLEKMRRHPQERAGSTTKCATTDCKPVTHCELLISTYDRGKPYAMDRHPKSDGCIARANSICYNPNVRAERTKLLLVTQVQSTIMNIC